MHQGTEANPPRTLWDIVPDTHKSAPSTRTMTATLTGRATPRSVISEPRVVAPPPSSGRRRHNGSAVAIVEATPSARQRYDEIVKLMKHRHEIRVRKWRSSNTGCAWQVEYEDGRVSRLIEAPYPRGPVSAAVFLHEIGHHAIGFTRYRPRCYEEYKAWEWALDTMAEFDIAITDRVRERVTLSLRYAVSKAIRRGIKRLPAELLPYI